MSDAIPLTASALIEKQYNSPLPGHDQLCSLSDPVDSATATDAIAVGYNAVPTGAIDQLCLLPDQDGTATAKLKLFEHWETPAT